MFYMYNFVFVVFVIVFIAGLTYGIGRSDVGIRSTLNATLLLTLVAFKLVMTSLIPKLSYQTFLDSYNIFAILTLCSIILENFLVSERFYEGENAYADHADMTFYLVVTCFWVLVHAFLFGGASSGLFQDSWEAVRRHDEKLYNSKQRESSNFVDENMLLQVTKLQTNPPPQSAVRSRRSFV